MPQSEFVPDPCRRSLERLLWQWLLLGGLLVAMFPDARGYSPLVGWLPLWWLAAPALCLMVLHRRTVRDWLAKGARCVARDDGRRRPRRRGAAQAQRVGTGLRVVRDGRARSLQRHA